MGLSWTRSFFESKYERLDKNKAMRRLDKNQIRIVILGSPQSGKSTIIRNLKLICMTFNYMERSLLKLKIAEKVLNDLFEILKEMEKSDTKFSNQETQNMADVYKNCILSGKRYSYLKDMAYTMKVLWDDENLQRFLIKNKVDISVAYFLNSLDRISSEKYWPSHKDISHYLSNELDAIGWCNLVEEIVVTYKNHPWKFTVVNETKTLEPESIRTIQECHYLIYCVSLTDFDFLATDEERRKFEETKKYFTNFLSIKAIEDQLILLLFTKKDLFNALLENIDLEKCSSDFKVTLDANNYGKAYEFFSEMLLTDPEIESKAKKRIFSYGAICSHDRDDIRNYLFPKELEVNSIIY